LISDENLAQLRALIETILDEKLAKYEIRKKPPEDISEKRRAAAMAMLAKRAERAIAEQMLPPKKLNGHAHSRANAEQKNGYDVIGEGDIVCMFPSLKGDVEVRSSYVLEMIEAYPGVMVAQEIDRAKLWCDANPTKRKTNVRKFLTNWIARKQG
jgi:hypothetical protein